MAHPILTYRAIRDDIVNKSGSLRGQGALVGDVLIGVATGGAMKAVSKTAVVARIVGKIKATRVGQAAAHLSDATIGRTSNAIARTKVGQAALVAKSRIDNVAARADAVVGRISGRIKRGAPNTGVRLIAGEAGVVTGGNSTKLGKNMMEAMGLRRSQKWTGYQAQHVIPSEMASHPVLQKIGMNLDDASNGMFLRVPDEGISAMSRHRGYHSTYNQVVERAFNRMDVSKSIHELQQEVFNLQTKLRQLQQQGTPLYPSQGATVELWERLLGQ